MAQKRLNVVPVIDAHTLRVSDRVERVMDESYERAASAYQQRQSLVNRIRQLEREVAVAKLDATRWKDRAFDENLYRNAWFEAAMNATADVEEQRALFSQLPERIERYAGMQERCGGLARADRLYWRKLSRSPVKP